MAHGRAEGAGLCQMLTTETQHSLSSKAQCGALALLARPR